VWYVITVYVVIPIALVMLGVLFYLRARASRQGMRCPNCNEYIRLELMDRNQRCATCGTPMVPTEEKHAQP